MCILPGFFWRINLLNNPIRTIYHTIFPESLKKKVVSLSSYLPLEIIYGKNYIEWSKWLDVSDSWSQDRIRAFQIAKLKDTFGIAYNCTPYYRRLFKSCGFNPSEFRYLDQMEKIPYLTKQIIQENIDSMVNVHLDKKQLLYYTTGGSTGLPMGMYKNVSDKVKEAAFVNYIWKAKGYRYNSRIAILRGAYYGESGLFTRVGNRMLISTYHMTEENMLDIYQAITKFRPEFLHVYPSAIYSLCKYMLENKLGPIPTVKCIYTASENLYPYQRESIEEAFECDVFDFYGHTEHACMAKQDSGGYLALWQYGFTELLYGNSGDRMEDDTLAEIVATTYDNTAMPLIRYKTMDFVTHGTDDNGKVFFKDIEGRRQDFIITSTGRKISIAAVNMHDEIFEHVLQYQFYQDDVNKCILKIVKKTGFNKEDAMNIRQEMEKKLGNDILMQMEYVDEIPRTRNGKYKFLDQRLME